MIFDKMYQIKDIINCFGTTRDTIKYYEKIGLITSQRLKNGYRVFDELNMHKIKKILSFHALGMTTEEIQKHCRATTISERAEIMARVRKRTEAEICVLNQRLKEIRDFELSVSENIIFSFGFNFCDDFPLCIGCQKINPEQRKTFRVMTGYKVRLSQSGVLSDVESCDFVVREFAKDCCKDCSNSHMDCKYYRGRIEYRSEEDMIEQITTARNVLLMQGLEVEDTTYMMAKVTQKGNQDALFLDVLLPLKG